MPLLVGGAHADGIQVGSVPAQKVYLGATQVWPVTQAAYFDAEGDQYVRNAAGLETRSFTMACFVRMEVARSFYQAFLSIDLGGENWTTLVTDIDGRTLWWSTGRTGNPPSRIIPGFQFTPGQWTFVAAVTTLGAGGDTLYWAPLNETLSSSSTLAEGSGMTDVGSSGWTLTIGNTAYLPEWWYGRIAGVKLWAAALSAVELEQERQSVNAVRTANLWASYPFGSGASTADASGNGRTLTAEGVIGSAPGPVFSAAVPTAPGTPTSVAGTPGNTSVTVTWAAPPTGGSPLTDYVVQWATAAAPTTWTTFAEGTSTATNTTVTGLTNGTAYIFRVAAVNAIGTGSYSDPSSSYTPSAPSVLAARFDSIADQYSRSGAGLEGSDLTMCCFVKISNDRNTACFFLSPDAGGSWWGVGVHTSGTELYWSTGISGVGSGNIRTGFNMTVGVWYFVAAVYRGGGTDTIYWGAVGAGSLSSNSTPTAGTIRGINDAGYTFRLGNTADSEWWDGCLGGVRVWTAALSEAELDAERAGYAAVRTANLWASYPFTAGPSTADASGNGRTLTAAGTITSESGPAL